MKPEGMVHALEEIHRLLRPGGSLIDIHPVPEAILIEVYHHDRVLFSETKPNDYLEDHWQAENALASIIERALFRIEDNAVFEFLTYGSSVSELRDFLAEPTAYAEGPVDEEAAARDQVIYDRVEKVMQATGKDAQVATHERARITCLRPTGLSLNSPASD